MADESLLDELLFRYDEAEIKPSAEDLCAECPHLLPAVRDAIARLSAFDALVGPSLGILDSDIDAWAPSRADDHPRIIGRYHVLGVIGEGGMGTVYKAEQREPFRRLVAIKVIKLGCDTRDVLARFDSERQALARMDHPHIARAIDAGTTDAGRPYFVMEYVPGTPITQFCDTNKLAISRRLELFIQVCEAIAHAHLKAIIHRDIKASNVLAYMLDGQPVAKVIDFGVAKAMTTDRLTSRTFNTAFGQVVGTYDSMSPEQAVGSEDIDTRTDVYALGVLLYELLAGAKPFDDATLARTSDTEVRRIIREVEPATPSSRLSNLGPARTQIAQTRQAQLKS
jgi:serine/threonine protein kinase